MRPPGAPPPPLGAVGRAHPPAGPVARTRARSRSGLARGGTWLLGTRAHWLVAARGEGGWVGILPVPTFAAPLAQPPVQHPSGSSAERPCLGQVQPWGLPGPVLAWAGPRSRPGVCDAVVPKWCTLGTDRPPNLGGPEHGLTLPSRAFDGCSECLVLTGRRFSLTRVSQVSTAESTVATQLATKTRALPMTRRWNQRSMPHPQKTSAHEACANLERGSPPARGRPQETRVFM